MSKLQKIVKAGVKGGVYFFTGNVIANIIRLLSAIIIARLLGPDNYGIFSLVIASAALFLIFTNFGIDVSLIHFIPKFMRKKYYGEVRSYIRVGVLAQLIITTILALLFLSLSNYISYYIINRIAAVNYVRIASIIIISYALLRTIYSVFYGLDLAKYSAILSIINSLLRLLLATLLIMLGYGIAGALWGHTISIVIPVLIAFAIILKINRDYDDDEQHNISSFAIIKEILIYGLPAYIGAAVYDFLNFYGKYLLAWTTSDYVIGNFSAALSLSLIFTIMASAIRVSTLSSFF